MAIPHAPGSHSFFAFMRARALKDTHGCLFARFLIYTTAGGSVHNGRVKWKFLPETDRLDLKLQWGGGTQFFQNLVI